MATVTALLDPNPLTFISPSTLPLRGVTGVTHATGLICLKFYR
jgi:hypothetical protein